MANALSLCRVLLALPFGLLMLRTDPGSALWAAALFGIAILTDLIDGPLARHRGTVSKLGGALDHGSDFVFVSVGLLALAWRGAIPWLLPPLVAIAFAQYVIDSLWIDRRPALRMSAIGRYNGIFYFVPSGVDIGVRLGLAVLARPNHWLGWLLVATTLISIGDRLLARSSRLSGAPDSPDAGRRDRSSR